MFFFKLVAERQKDYPCTASQAVEQKEPVIPLNSAQWKWKKTPDVFSTDDAGVVKYWQVIFNTKQMNWEQRSKSCLPKCDPGFLTLTSHVCRGKKNGN